MELLERAHGWEPRSGKKVEMLIAESGEFFLSPSDGEAHVIVIESGVEATILEEGNGSFTVDIVVKENAQAKYRSASASEAERFAYLEENARIFWTDAAIRGATSIVTSYLAGKGSDAQFQSVFLGKGEERYTIKSRMIHMGDKSTSNMLTRSVMLDSARGEYEGLIRIDENAAGCDAYQKEETLLLSRGARMDATPNLEISNEDVRCSHGVSLGQIDEEKLFYLASRGIGRAEAIQLIVKGFFSTILDGTPLKERVLARLEV